MARTVADSSQLPRPVVLSSISLLHQSIPLPVVTSTLQEHNRRGDRDRLLPAPFLVYFIVALSLYMPYALREVLRCVLDGFQHLGLSDSPCFPIATKGAISRARTRLGWEVMAAVFDRVARPLATPSTPGAWYRGRRVVAFDGTTVAAPATGKNIAAFGLHGGKEGASAFPLVRLVALVEVGTHAIVRVALDACATAESSLARQLLPALGAGMLVLEDRGFVGYPWWRQVCATGAEALCRVRNNMRFPVDQPLADGSYLSVLRPGTDDDGDPVAVRVIAYTLRGVPKANTVHRLITSLLDPDAAPARELAALYHERWEAETTFDEFKTHLRGGAHIILRSKTPDLVKQEIFGLLLAHYTVRAVMHEAALRSGEDPDRLSFTHTVRVVRRKLPQAAAHFSPRQV